MDTCGSALSLKERLGTLEAPHCQYMKDSELPTVTIGKMRDPGGSPL